MYEHHDHSVSSRAPDEQEKPRDQLLLRPGVFVREAFQVPRSSEKLFPHAAHPAGNQDKRSIQTGQH